MNKKLLLLFLFILTGIYSYAQEFHGERIYGGSVTATTSELMQHWANQPLQKSFQINNFIPFQNTRENLPQPFGNTNDLQSSGTELNKNSEESSTAAQTTGITFTGATYSDANTFPPDASGAAGTTQFMVFINGRIRTFSKTTGTADGVLDIDPAVFFNSVMTVPGVGESTTLFNSNVRYDRLSGRWFLSILEITANGTTITKPNRILIAVSDNDIITGSTVWTLNYFQNSASDFSTTMGLGIDAEAVYVGTVQLNTSQSLIGTNGYVVNKASLYTGTPIVTVFANLTGSPTGAGPFAPRGVDNFDPNNTGSSAVGYFIGVDNATFSTLMLRRVTDPGGSPTISGNISLTVPTTTFPNRVTHFGNTGGTNGNLATLDDRLFAAHIRNNRLWTAHNFRVSAAGVASTTAQARNAIRWYELNVPTSGSPSLIQSGTIFDNTTNLSDAKQYWIPSIMVSGQGHAAVGFSAAGTPFYINAGLTGRLSGDALGTMRPVTLYTSSSTAYNPSGDAGGPSGRQWGEYSYTCLDPNDDMTMWTLQEYCSGTNTWGVGVAQILAPLPSTPTTATPGAVPPENSVDVTITGSVVDGSGFFDPGTGFLNRITASLPGGIIVNSVTYNSPTEVVLNLNTTGVANGLYAVTITNPDGQSVTSSSGILEVNNTLPVELSSFTASMLKDNGVKLNWRTETETANFGFDIERTSLVVKETTWEKIGFVNGNGNSASPKNYSFVDAGVRSGKYEYRLKQIDNDGSFKYSSVVNVDLGSPSSFGLSQNYPNPFNPSTVIKFNYEKRTEAQLKVYDVLGVEIADLFNGIAEAGRDYEISFEGSGFPSGVYYYKLTGNGVQETKKMLLLK